MDALSYLLTAKEVCRLLKISRCSLWRWQRTEDFPKPRQIGPNRVAYVSAEISAWLESRPVTLTSADSRDTCTNGGQP